jgi:hypothetical protein
MVRGPGSGQDGLHDQARGPAARTGLNRVHGRVLAPVGDPRRTPARPGWDRAEIALAAGAFLFLCIAVLAAAPFLVEPDDWAYRASIVAMPQGHFLTLTTAQVHALGRQLAAGHGGRPGLPPWPIPQWVQLPGGRWISEKDPGYPFLAAPFQALGVIRLAPLFYGGLACLGLFAGARRWLGRPGGAAAAGLFCSSGAALLFAWRDYMPTFTDASLIAAGTGALLWAVLARDVACRWRTVAGLAGFAALEAAVFARYTDVVVLGCAVVAVIVAWRRRVIPAAALGWWLGSVAVSGAALATFDDLVYGGPLTSGYRPGEITFSLAAIPRNLRFMPAHLIEAMPVLVLGLAALAGLAGRLVRQRRRGGEGAAVARRDLAVGLALAASWCGVWGLYAAYTWTAGPGLSTLQAARFYVPAIGAIALLGAWLVVRLLSLVRLPPRAPVTALTPAAVVLLMAGLGLWAFGAMRDAPMGGMIHRGGPPGQVARAASGAAGQADPATPAVPYAIAARGTAGNAPAS